MDKETFKKKLDKISSKAIKERIAKELKHKESMENNMQLARQQVIEKFEKLGNSTRVHIDLAYLEKEQLISLLKEIEECKDIICNIDAGPGYDTDGYPKTFLRLELRQ